MRYTSMCENGNQDSILRRDEFLRDVRNPPHLAVLYAHREESTFNKRALHREDAAMHEYTV